MMTTGWRITRLGNLVSFKTGKLDSNAAVPGGAYPFFTCSQETLRTNTFSFDTECVLLAGNNANGIFPLKYFHGKFDAYQRTYIVRPHDTSELSTKFLYYALRPKLSELRSFSTGAATKFLTLTILNETQIRYPPIEEQRRIAGILSAYDELIENSQRRIKILEEMARSLYREWFVHFRFPGHESHPRVASTLGVIPKGWEAIPFEKLLVSMTGGDWGSEQPDEDDSSEVGIVRGTDFDEVAYGGDLRVPVRYIKPSSLKSRGLRLGDVVVENSVNAKTRCIGTPLIVDDHVLARLGRSAVAASFCKVFRFHEASVAPIAHLHLRHLREEKRMEYYQNVATNGIGNFQAQKFAKEEYLTLPIDPKLRTDFIGRIAEMLHGISLLASQIQNYRRTRDLLLTRLTAGEPITRFRLYE